MRTLFVLNLPSPFQEQWQNDLSEAALRAGWEVLFHDPEGDPLVSQENRLIFCEGFDAQVGEIEDWVILADKTAPTALYLEQRFGISSVEAKRSISRRYAHANVAASLGVCVMRSDAPALQLQGLGLVTRSGLISERREQPDALAFYDQLPLRAGASAEWSRPVFLGPLPEISGPLDLTGRRRVLQHGPYFELCPGTWTATVTVALDAGSAATDLRFEWGTAEDVATASHSINRPGLYAITLSKEWHTVAPAEFRIWLDRSMFDGNLQLMSCKVSFEP